MNKRTLLFFFLVLHALVTYAQSGCDCPSIAVCHTCSGGITTFTLVYNGTANAGIKVFDDATLIYSQTLKPGDTFTLDGSQADGRFVSSSLIVLVNNIFDVEIKTTCGLVFDPNMPYGSFIMTAAESKNGVLCCSSHVADAIPPTFENIPSDITVDSDNACTTVVTWIEPTAVDCNLKTVTQTKKPGQSFPMGTTKVTYTATDNAGNKTSINFNVTVNDIPPIPSNVPADITVSASAGCTANVTWTPPTFKDNCGAVSVTSSPNPGSAFPIGTTQVTYTATDVNNNKTTVSFKVTVNDVAPVASNVPSNITRTASDGCTATATWTPPTFKDNCGAVTVKSSHDPGFAFQIGKTQVTYTGTDANNNKTTVSFYVTVNDVAPVVSNVPGDITVAADDNCTASPDWTPPTFTDNCGTVTVTRVPAAGYEFPLGKTVVTYTGKDKSGLNTTCSFNVFVEDQTAPVFMSCPQTITVTANETCSAKPTWTAPTTKDCSAVTLTSSHPGPSFDVGETVVTYTAEDAKGNKSTCSFSVIVKDGVPPTISNCPNDIQVIAHSNERVAVDWVAPTAADGCTAVSLTSTHSPGDLFPVDTTVVAYIAKDAGDNVATCSFNVAVVYEDLMLQISKVITPDGNGTNDEWIIGNIEKYESNSVLIVDRWGSPVYRASGYNNTSTVWTGTNTSGGQLPTGTYFYTVSVKEGGVHLEKRGFIELVR